MQSDSPIWHAVFGFEYDIVPAKKLGYTAVWLNRKAQVRPGRVKETFLVGDMRALAYLVIRNRCIEVKAHGSLFSSWFFRYPDYKLNKR